MSETKLSDEDLIERFRSGDKISFELLLERYKNVVRGKTKLLFLIGGERDDLIQEGMIGLYKAVQSFESGRGVPFAGFADMCIEHQMQSAILKAARKKNGPLNDAVSYFSIIKKDDGEEYPLEVALSDNNLSNPEYQIVDAVSAQMIQQKIMMALSPYERNVLLLHMDGMPYTQIAEMLGKTPKSVDNALNRIKKKIAQILGK